MALQSVRLRRALTSISTLHRTLYSAIIPATEQPSSIAQNAISLLQSARSPILLPIFQSRTFTGSRVSLSSSTKQYKLWKEGDEITEDTVLFEGCDFNHWLITMDFPKDPKPTPEEMVATYERTCAQGLGISIEEAKKKIYACSTTTYQGFQAVMTEEESEKFRELPGVVFILPDSYIDPQNKEYGGDKYENGVITPRPPPVQYQREGRFRNRNRNPDQRRYDQQGPMPNRQGSPQYDQGSVEGGGRNYGPRQNYPPRQNYGPPQDYPPQQNYGPPNYPAQQNYGPPSNYPPQQNYGPPQNYPPQQNYDHPQNSPRWQQYGSSGQGMPVNNVAPGRSDCYQPNRGAPMPQRGFQQGDQRDYGYPGQRDFRGDNRNHSSTDTGTYGERGNTDYGQGYPGQSQRPSEMEQGSQGSFAGMEQTGPDRGRY